MCRREDLRVALLAELVGDEVLQFLTENGAVGRPEDEALAHIFVDVEKFEVAAEFAVVAELGLFELREVVGELVLRRKGGAVDTLELFVLFVAAVIGAGDREEFERLQLRGVADVRAGAEVHEFAVLVEGDFFALGDISETAEFVAFLAAGLDDLDGLFAGDFLAEERLVFVGDFFHLRFELREILGGEFVVEIDVVIETRVGRRPDIEFGLGVEAKERGRQHVRARVTKFFERSHGHGDKAVLPTIAGRKGEGAGKRAACQRGEWARETGEMRVNAGLLRVGFDVTNSV